jgi:hypothetical protein
VQDFAKTIEEHPLLLYMSALSVAVFFKPIFISWDKRPKTTGIFDDVDHPKSRGVTYWAERIGPLVDHIN